MQRTLMVGKIHRATVTHADLHYVGSLTIDANLMKAANIVEGERVQIVDITNGARLETYAITGEPDSGTIGINGAAARLVHPGDLVIIITYGLFDDNEVDAHRPTVIHVDEHNRQVDIGDDPAEPVPGAPNQYNGRR